MAGYRAKPASPALQFGNPLANVLIGAWPFAEGSGTTLNDFSGRGNQGAFVGTPAWVGSPYGASLSFSGAGDYIDLGTASRSMIAANSSFTVAMTVIPAVLDSQQRGLFASWGTPQSLLICTTGSTRVLLVVRGGATGSVIQFNSASALSVGNLYRIVCTVTRTAACIYINEQLDASVTGSLVGISGSPGENFNIGRKQDSNTTWGGQIIDCTVDNRAWSPDDVVRYGADPFSIYRAPSRLTIWAPSGGTTIYTTYAMPSALSLILASDRADPAASASFMMRDGVIPLGVGQAVQADASLPVALHFALLVDAALPIADALTLITDTALPTAACMETFVDTALPLASRVGALMDAALPALTRVEMFADSVLPLGIGIATQSDGVLPLSVDVALVSTEALPLAASGTIVTYLSADSALPLATVAARATDQVLPAAGRLALTADETTVLATLVALAKDEDLALAKLRILASTEALPLSAAGVINAIFTDAGLPLASSLAMTADEAMPLLEQLARKIIARAYDRTLNTAVASDSGTSKAIASDA